MGVSIIAISDVNADRSKAFWLVQVFRVFALVFGVAHDLFHVIFITFVPCSVSFWALNNKTTLQLTFKFKDVYVLFSLNNKAFECNSGLHFNTFDTVWFLVVKCREWPAIIVKRSHLPFAFISTTLSTSEPKYTGQKHTSRLKFVFAIRCSLIHIANCFCQNTCFSFRFRPFKCNTWYFPLDNNPHTHTHTFCSTHSQFNRLKTTRAWSPRLQAWYTRSFLFTT